MGDLLTLVFRSPDALPFQMIQESPVLIVMAVYAQILPVAPVGWVIVMIVILMMDRQHVDIFIGKLTAAACAYPRVYPQGLLTVSFKLLLLRLSHPRHNLRYILPGNLSVD